MSGPFSVVAVQLFPVSHDTHLELKFIAASLSLSWCHNQRPEAFNAFSGSHKSRFILYIVWCCFVICNRRGGEENKKKNCFVSQIDCAISMQQTMKIRDFYFEFFALWVEFYWFCFEIKASCLRFWKIWLTIISLRFGKLLKKV
jgi:hypothetical protein